MEKRVLYLLILFLSAVAGAVPLSPQGMTLQGTILTPTGLPEEGASVAFTIQIRSPAATDCLLYSEGHTLNMSGSGGAFSINMGSGTRAGGGFQSTSTLAQVFNNASAAINPLTCSTAVTSYTPASGDSRVVKITFDDGSGPQTLTQSLSVQAVPYALYADRLEGKSSTDFIQVNTASGKVLSQANLESVFASSANLTELLALIGGTSTQYTATSGNPSFTGNVSVGGTLSSTGNVGIGTSTPTRPLHIQNANPLIRLEDAAGTSTNAGMSYTVGGVEKSYLRLGNNSLDLIAGDSSWVTTNGLKINTPGHPNGDFTFNVSGNPTDFRFRNFGGGWDYASILVGYKSNASQQYMLLKSAGGVNQLMLDYTGNVGIGAANPNAALQVVGNQGTVSSPHGTAGLNVVGGAGYASGNGNGGAISLVGGLGTGSGSGGDISLTSGAGNSDTFTRAGNITISPGTGYAGGSTVIYGANYGGQSASYLNLSGGSSTTTGSVLLSAGASGALVGTGGSMTLQTPNVGAGWNSSAGNISITAGNGDGTGVGGAINITAGSGGASNINGSNIVLNGGAKGGSGSDGFVVLADARGKVGVGTNSPVERFHVLGGDAVISTSNMSSGSQLYLRSTLGGGVIEIKDMDDTNSVQGEVKFTDGSGTAVGRLGGYNLYTNGEFGLRSNKALNLDAGNTTRIRIDGTTGNVGIGTSSPAVKLDVNGTMKLAKNGSAPFACDATKDAVIALTSQYTTCVCKGGTTSWVLTADGITACSW